MAQAEPSTIFQYESFPGLRTTGQVERAIVGEKLHDGVQIMGIECVRDCLQGFYGDRLHGYFIFSKTRVLTLIFPSLDLGEGGVVSITLSPSLLTSRRRVVPVNTSFQEISM